MRYRGEDVARGDVLAPAGTALGVQHVTALASAGVGAVAVHRRPVVHVLATGTELLELGAAPEPGRIHESNRLTLRLLAERAGAEVVVHPVVPDDAAATRRGGRGARWRATCSPSRAASRSARTTTSSRRWRSAASRRSSGACGSSPASRCGSAAATRRSCSGCRATRSPRSRASCSSSGPALRRLQGESGAAPRFVPARLAAPARPADGRTTLLTARLEHGADGVLEATPTEGQGSHLTGALAASDGFVAIPHDAGELPAGARVDALLL